MIAPGQGLVYFDLVVHATTVYTPFDNRLNGLNGRFAQVNVAVDTEVGLRVSTMPSCCTTTNCARCELGSLTSAERTACFARGCCCFGVTVTDEIECRDQAREEKRLRYECLQMDTSITLPQSALISMSIFDFDSGPSDSFTESISFSRYAYVSAPLRPTSGNDVNSLVDIQYGPPLVLTSREGDAPNPSDPQSLSDDQAARGVQVFFRPTLGYVEANFRCHSRRGAASIGAGSTDCNLLFAGDSALCVNEFLTP
jgi:hypothetical protein